MDVRSHPHVGLATVTWLLSGEVEHRDSLGVVQRIRPGQLNVMTAGDGIVHAELGVPGSGPVHGVQLWLALPEGVRAGPPRFDHLAAVPRVELPGASVRVLLGEVGGTVSPAPAPWPVLGGEVRVDGPASVPLRPAFEHGWLTVEGDLRVEGAPAPIGELLYLGDRRDTLRLDGAGTGMLLGGAPFEEPLLMWWNWVARTDAEIRQAWARWDSGAMAPVPGESVRIDAPPLPRER